MSSQVEVCRTCLSTDHLIPIFIGMDPAQSSKELMLTTGLKIEFNDGLPQTMCKKCLYLMRQSLTFRFRSRRAERSLFQVGYQTLLSRDIDEIGTKKEYTEILFEPETINKASDLDPETMVQEEHVEYVYNKTESFNDEDYCNEEQRQLIKAEDTSYAVKIEKDVETYIIDGEFVLNECMTDGNEIIIEKADSDYSGGNDFVVEEVIETTEDAYDAVHKSNDDSTDENGKRKMSRIRNVIRNRGNRLSEGDGEFWKKCYICGLVLNSKISYRQHLRQHGFYRLICEYCGRCVYSRYGLMVHYRSKHGMERVDKCKYCSFTANNPSSVKIHERIHTGERPYTCDVCGDAFRSKAVLAQHTEVHRPEKTVQCDICPKMFKSVQRMSTHKVRVHQVQLYKYQCYLCPSIYSRQHNVRKHLIRVHNVRREDQKRIGRIKIEDSELGPEAQEMS